MQSKGYEAYKYVMADTSYLYLGAKYSYQEIIENEEVPFKVKAIMERYILTSGMDKDTTLESHFYYLSPSSFEYQTYLQVKARVKVNRLKEKRGLFGKKKKVYVTEMMPVKELAKMDAKQKEKEGIFIQEVAFSKFALMSFVV